jgi:hypothetical protein
VTAQGDPERDPERDPEPESRPKDGQATRLRRLVQIGGAAVALWFIANGLKGMWPDVGVLGRVLIAVAAVLVVAFVVLGGAYVMRRDRRDQ